MTTPRARLLVAGVAALAIAACTGEPTTTPRAPNAVTANAATAANQRTLGIQLTTSSAGGAGMIFSIEGPNIVSVAPAPGFDLVASPATSTGRDRMDVLVSGPLRSGVIAWLTVKGVNSGHPYDVTVTQVAAGASEGYAQRDPGAYSLAVGR